MDPAFFLLQIFAGLVSGSFYALLSLGLAVIFGMLRVVNFAHGSFYMLGAFAAYIMLQQLGLNFWLGLFLAPLLVACLGMLLEWLLIRRLYALDALYNFLLTFGIAIILQDAVRLRFGVQGQPYLRPVELQGVVSIGLNAFPIYRLFVIVFSLIVCAGVWFVIERTRVGMVVRAATEKGDLTRALGIDVDRWITPVFGFDVGLAALGGTGGADVQRLATDGRRSHHRNLRGGRDRRPGVDPGLGHHGTGGGCGRRAGRRNFPTTQRYPGLRAHGGGAASAPRWAARRGGQQMRAHVSRYGGYAAGVLILLLLPRLVYPVLALDILRWGLFAVALDLLLGFAGLLSFGHAMFWGIAGYAAAISARAWRLPIPVAVVIGMLVSSCAGSPRRISVGAEVRHLFCDGDACVCADGVLY